MSMTGSGDQESGGKKPSTPTIGTATVIAVVNNTAGNTAQQASVTFTPSAYAGKGTVTYTVTSSGGATATGSSSPITVSGLTASASVTFTGRAYCVT
jgi:hypothetical protein